MSTDDVEFGSGEVTVRMLMVIIELRNSDTVKDTVTDGDCKGRFTHCMPFSCHAVPLRV